MLKINSTIEKLELKFDNIKPSDQNTINILKNCNLKELNLRDNSIGDRGLMEFTGALRTNSTITKLNLSNNKIGDSGCKALIEVFSNSISLTFLDISKNRFTDEGLKALINYCYQDNEPLTKKLNLQGNNIKDRKRFNNIKMRVIESNPNFEIITQRV